MNDQDLTVLDDTLSGKNFIAGTAASKLDCLVYSSLTDKLPFSPPNVARWAQHMAALSPQQREKLPQKDFKPSNDKKLTSQLNSLVERLTIEDNRRKLYTTVSSSTIPSIKNMSSNSITPCSSKDVKSLPTKGGGKVMLKTAKGTRDYHPAEMAIRRRVFDKIKSVFHMHGAVEIETPVFELKEVLTGKYGEDSKLIYDLEDQGGEILSLRYDLTVPFARYVAQNKISNISRYHIARVYRRDNPAMTRGRYREFYQCDFDIAGQYDLMLPDAECVQVIHQVLTSLNLGDFVIKVNHRKLLDGLFGACGVPAEKFRPICSAVDKLDKSPWCEVRKEMVEEKGLDGNVADLIGDYVKLNGKQDLLDTLKMDERLNSNEDIQIAIKELELMVQYTSLLQCDTHMLIDMSLARGLDYYTGVIYEAVLLNTGKAIGSTSEKKKSKKKNEDEDGPVGSVAGGGRYDGLVGMFDAKNRTVPCVGVSFGIERLFAIQERKMKLREGKVRATLTSVYIAGVCKGMLPHRLTLCALLHSADVKAETSRKLNPKFLNQLQYAEETGIPLVLAVGDSEISDGVVIVRNTLTREETKVKRDDLIQHIKQILPALENED